jgi:hypothetical protein
MLTGFCKFFFYGSVALVISAPVRNSILFFCAQLKEKPLMKVENKIKAILPDAWLAEM